MTTIVFKIGDITHSASFSDSEHADEWLDKIFTRYEDVQGAQIIFKRITF